MQSKNYTIILLYFSVFLIISILTAYFPIWLNKDLKLDPKHIGYILSLVGVLKVFFRNNHIYLAGFTLNLHNNK